MAQTIIEALQTYMLGCPLLADHKINVDYLPEKGVEYSIDTVPSAPATSTFTCGGGLCQYLFVIRSVNYYGPDELQNITNAGIFEQLSDWLHTQTLMEHFPALPPGKTPYQIGALNTGYLFATDPAYGKYQIQCGLNYVQEV